MKNLSKVTPDAGENTPVVTNWEDVLFPDDYRRVQALLCGDEPAERWFHDCYGAQVLQTALSWCRPNCVRSGCRLKTGRLARLMEAVFGSDCDEVSDAYAFLWGELKGRILRGYRGRASLRSFLFPIFNRVSRRDGHRRGCNYYTLFASYLAWKRGKYVAPKWVMALPKFDRDVHREALYGRDGRQAALRLKCEPADVEESLQRIEEAARKTGPETLWAWLLALNGGEVSLNQPLADDEGQRTVGDTIASHLYSSERLTEKSEALRLIAAALEQLCKADRELLYFRCRERLTGQAVALKLGTEMKKVYEQEQRALEAFNRCMSELNPDYKSLTHKDLREGLGGLLGSVG